MPVSRWLPIFFLVLVFPWFFLLGPDYVHLRTVKELWDFGHVIFFMIFALVVSRVLLNSRDKSGSVPEYEKRNFAITSFIYTFLIVSVVVFGIEAIQSRLPDRDASIRDALYGLAGASAVLLWKFGDMRSKFGRIVLKACGVTIIAACLVPFFLAATDDYRMYRNFPVLSDFECFQDTTRWKDRERLSRVREPVSQGNYSLKVSLTTERYSGVSLTYFPEDWTGAKALCFSVFNPDAPVRLFYRVHDKEHRGDRQTYNNRYNGRSILKTGWNKIVIDMKEIENGPEFRKLDLRHVRDFTLFVSNQPSVRTIFIDDVRLVLQ